ncbi:glucose-6-phosphate isomerase [Fusobacterium sp. PH5-44]|uniref:glucose-6-phosphate isomerase n=1 Tax=unclassified Fusobacterium TaxID=2648384 RepID=UPI003D1C0360
MEKTISFDYSNALDFLCEEEINMMEGYTNLASEYINNKNGAGNDFLGWVDLPTKYDKAELKRIKKTSEKIKNNSEILVVIGIGGSYLGARAAIDFLSHSFYNSISKEKRGYPEIYFAGNNISGTYMEELLELLDDSNYSINVISKSGTTTEPAIAFRILKEHIERKYGKKEAKNRIFVTTDKDKGALKILADEEGYETFVIPSDIGGRFSVLTAVGLLPIACAGVDVSLLLNGAKMASKEYSAKYSKNSCYKYAAIRNILYKKGKMVEMLINYEPKLHYIGEWWKQLFGESEGKDKKGIFPATADFSTDLHSMGQYIQDGQRLLFETAVIVEGPLKDIKLKKEESDLDGLNYLAGKTMNHINEKAAQGTLLAHVDGGVPNLIIKIKDFSPYSLGYLFYFFEKACAISGYLLGVNPFDQPGVESYKKNMFALLGKKGYEKEGKLLRKRIK